MVFNLQRFLSDAILVKSFASNFFIANMLKWLMA